MSDRPLGSAADGHSALCPSCRDGHELTAEMGDRGAGRALEGPASAGSAYFLHRRFDVRLDLVGIRHAVEPIEEIGHRDHLTQSFVIQAQPQHGGGMGVDSIGAAIGDGDGQSDDLLGEQIQLPRTHDGLELVPGHLEMIGTGGQGAPDIGHDVDALGLLDILEDRLDPAGRLLLADQSYEGYTFRVPSSRKRIGRAEPLAMDHVG